MPRSHSIHSRKRFRVLAIAIAVAAPAVAGGQAKRGLSDFRALALSQPARPFTAFSIAALTTRDSLAAFARAQVGKRYRFGGTSPERGFDCSGLVQYVLDAFKVEIPRTSVAQARFGAAIPRDHRQFQPGDLLLFGQPRAGVSHVGIYVGGGRYIHASSVAGRVIESPLDRPPSARIKVLKSARRVVTRGDTVSLTTIIAARGQY
jgi:cell wall-associated NlpC family hydrolase